MRLIEIRKCVAGAKFVFAATTLFLFAALALIACNSGGEPPAFVAKEQTEGQSAAVNINTASVEDLRKIPYIGEKLASKIVEHRERYGPFGRPEDLMLVPGISDARFRAMRDLICVY